MRLIVEELARVVEQLPGRTHRSKRTNHQLTAIMALASFARICMQRFSSRLILTALRRLGKPEEELPEGQGPKD
ncbi:hypothetical protein BVX97_04225 [bacterium E08(2017)]|nr:hypothetical protein BVX97_04225 [bacterium E08(2017)]